jgi:mRNA deadenylase 3'-5' endonuclease subunit Ccr4
MLVQEASQMADWYLQQQQELDAAAADGSSSRKGGCAAVAPRGVATIIAGDFNATPNSPMYTFLSKGCIDLHKVSYQAFMYALSKACNMLSSNITCIGAAGAAGAMVQLFALSQCALTRLAVVKVRELSVC